MSAHGPGALSVGGSGSAAASFIFAAHAAPPAPPRGSEERRSPEVPKHAALAAAASSAAQRRREVTAIFARTGISARDARAERSAAAEAASPAHRVPAATALSIHRRVRPRGPDALWAGLWRPRPRLRRAGSFLVGARASPAAAAWRPQRVRRGFAEPKGRPRRCGGCDCK